MLGLAAVNMLSIEATGSTAISVPRRPQRSNSLAARMAPPAQPRGKLAAKVASSGKLLKRTTPSGDAVFIGLEALA